MSHFPQPTSQNTWSWIQSCSALPPSLPFLSVSLYPFFFAVVLVIIICNLGSSVWQGLQLETRLPSQEGAWPQNPQFLFPDQQRNNSSSVLWYHLNQPALVWIISSLLMRDKLRDHNCARMQMSSNRPCFMWIKRINAVVLIAFLCIVLLSLLFYRKSLVCVVYDISIILCVIELLLCANVIMSSPDSDKI